MDGTVVAEGVRKEYGDTVALDGVSLSVAEGEVFALLGPNGAGKTTLVRALTGTTDTTDGDVEVFGTSPTAVDRSRIGVLPQSFTPPERLSARELLSYYAGLYDETRDVDAVLSDVGLAADAEVRYEALSGGQQRRVCLGITLVNDPDLLVLDEPTSGIDPAGRRAVREQVADLAAGGTTVLLTTHDVPEAERLADRVGVLAEGELVACGTPSELVRAYGAGTRLTIETDAGPDALAGLDRSVETSARGLVVDGVTPGEIDAVVRTLEEAGVTFSALHWSEPGLEDVYFAATGVDDAIAGSRSVAAGDRRSTTATGTVTSGGDSE